MKETIQSVCLVNAINGSSIAVLTLNDVKDGVDRILRRQG